LCGLRATQWLAAAGLMRVWFAAPLPVDRSVSQRFMDLSRRSIGSREWRPVGLLGVVLRDGSVAGDDLKMADLAVLEGGDPGGDGLLLWDVIEEHLDEASFCLSHADRVLDDPLLTLADLERSWEPRWIAHVDGLVVGGDRVRDQLLIPALEGGESERVTACSIALLASGERERVVSGVRTGDAEVRGGIARGCALRPDAGLSGVVRERLGSAASAEERAGLLELLAALQVGTPDIVRYLCGEEAIVRGAAVRVAPYCEPGVDVVRELERLLADGAPELIEPAAIAALTLGSTTAFSVFERRVVDAAGSVSRTGLALLAALGGPVQHARVIDMLAEASLTAPALFALGYSGNLDAVPALLERAKGSDARLARLSLQSLAMILGIDPGDEALAVPAQEEVSGPSDGAPSVEEDVVEPDAEFSPLREDELPRVDPERLGARVASIQSGLDGAHRYLAGQRYGDAAVYDVLEQRPLGWRHVWATVVLIATGGQGRIDTRARSRQQREQLAALRARPTPAGPRFPMW
jgi:uncharacterized protein (TIGR02270 family)